MRSVQINPSNPSVDADNPPAMPQNRRAHRAANDGVQPGAVSSSVCNADGLDGLSHRSSVGGRLQGLKRKKLFYTIREMSPGSSNLYVTNVSRSRTCSGEGKTFAELAKTSHGLARATANPGGFFMEINKVVSSASDFAIPNNRV